STVRYLADYTFHFYPDKVRRLLRKIDLTATASGGRIIVLPVYQDGAQAMLWDDPNPWREAWSERPSDSGPIRLIVPLGDVGDLAAIDAERAEAGRPDALKAVARRNGGGAVVVAVAKLQRSDDQLAGVNVKLSEYRDGRLVGSGGKSIAADPGEDQAALLRRAVAAAADAIAGLKTVAAGASAPPSADAAGKGEGSIAAVVPIASLDDWIAVRRRLVSVPTIRGIELLSLSREEARIRLHYIGSPDRLKTDLAAVDLALDGGDPVWRVHPAGASDPP
ncbi:MAG TPA: DUF2066 domain-containing protein, partial [Stellaceae bacterium]|nr:DUF2066 domain-containing protein [Stellaceae bacterium]